MQARRSILGLALILVGCGKKADDAANTSTAVAAAMGAATGIQKGQEEAERFYNDRKAKGDTLAMPFAALEKFLPAPPTGYKAAEAPAGSGQNLPGFSMSQASQTFIGGPDTNGSIPRIVVTVIDLGGTQVGYTTMALPLMMGMSSEDAHRRTGTVKMDTPYTWGYEEYDKDNKSNKITVVTRYRYEIAVEAFLQGTDHGMLVKDLAEGVAKHLTDR